MAKKKRVSRAVAMVRAERALRDREAIKVLRQHFTGYEAADGYSLDTRKIAALPAHQRRALRKKYTRVQRLLATPHVIVKPRTVAEAKVLRRETQQRFKGTKNFVVHVPDPERSTAEIVGGRLQIRTKFPGRAEVEERMFRFPRRAKGPDDMVAMLQEILPGMPRTGIYVLQTDTYGDTGPPIDYGQLLDELRENLAAYDREKYGSFRYLNRLVGFRWVRSRLAGRIVRQHRSEARAAQRKANRERREQLAREARRAAKKT